MVHMTLRMIDLLKEPEYRKYFLKAPRFPYPIAVENPWKVWVRKEHRGKMVWRSRGMPTFKDAFLFCKPHYRSWDDFSITSMVVGFQPPKKVQALYSELDWCYRCRRPSEFRQFRRHHALDSSIHQWFSHTYVCPYCGYSGGNNSMTVVKG